MQNDDSSIRVGVLEISLLVRSSHSLKEKRQVVRSLKDGIRAKFNVSIAEVGALDKWQKIVLGVAAVSNDKRHLDETLSKVVDWARKDPVAELLDYAIEIF